MPAVSSKMRNRRAMLKTKKKAEALEKIILFEINFGEFTKRTILQLLSGTNASEVC